MQVQVLLAMGKDCLSKEEARELLDQQVHMVTTTQELRHITINFMWVAGVYLCNEGILKRAIDTWR